MLFFILLEGVTTGLESLVLCGSLLVVLPYAIIDKWVGLPWVMRENAKGVKSLPGSLHACFGVANNIFHPLAPLHASRASKTPPAVFQMTNNSHGDNIVIKKTLSLLL